MNPLNFGGEIAAVKFFTQNLPATGVQAGRILHHADLTAVRIQKTYVAIWIGEGRSADDDDIGLALSAYAHVQDPVRLAIQPNDCRIHVAPAGREVHGC